MDPTLRFSDRVSDYAAYRPGYPEEILGFLGRECGLSSGSVIADVGSGTGKLTELFLSNGNTVYAVEPNGPMRAQAEKLLSGRPGFRSVDGRAEATTLRDASVDMVTAGQAFHWFEPEAAAAEFRRILRGNGFAALIWNDREPADSPFFSAYDAFLLVHSADYGETDRRNRMGPEVYERFFGGGFGSAEFKNVQIRDFDNVLGGYLSASYAFTRDHPRFPEARQSLKEIFDEYAVGGRLAFPYRTRVVYARFGGGRR